MQYRSLIPSSPDPFADTFEVFNGDTAPGASGGFNDFLRNAVIRVSGETGLPARQLFQFSLCAASLLLLQFGAQASMPVPHALDGRATVGFAVAGRCDFRDAEVHTEKVIDIGGFGIVDVAGRGEIEYAALENQVRFPLSGLQQVELSRTSLKRNPDSPVNGPDGHGLRLQVPGQNAVVIRDRAFVAKYPLGLLVQLVSIADFSCASNHHLGRQRKTLSRVGIAEFVDCELTEYLRLPGATADPVAAGISQMESIKQCDTRRIIGNQFDFRGQLHYPSSIETKLAKSNPAESRRYPPQELI